MPAPQNYKNHARFDPLFHFFLAPVSILNVVLLFIWHLRHRWFHPHLFMWAIFMSIVFMLAVTKIRLYALRNQDRIIRLEERLRYERLLPTDLLGRSADLSLPQIIALRFASDAELPELMKRTLTEGLVPKTIKQAIQSWRPDYDRI